jgi:hypothetical protein
MYSSFTVHQGHMATVICDSSALLVDAISLNQRITNSCLTQKPQLLRAAYHLSTFRWMRDQRIGGLHGSLGGQSGT